MELPIQCQFSSIEIHDLKLKVRLGCEKEERTIPQFVSFDAEVRFKHAPRGCLTDQLEDTVCYADLCSKIRLLCEGTEYHLIEKLAWEAYGAIKEILPETTELKVKVTKEKPPVRDLHGGSIFIISDWR
jgi:dihydroneopterin aldolase